MTADEQKQLSDMVEVRGKIERIEHHMKLFKEGQAHSDEMHKENSKKLDTILATFTDSPYNANNGFVKRLNAIEKVVDNHVLYWRIAIGSLTGGGVLWGLIQLITKH